ncbi:aspartyl-phosphate phosphatase Spo0E family protein [Heyndrickxia acidicola]|uniref:Aspartyl-phosphate phosphatase Spo0E family protein n=1 Tax=Heyndrickxia acidicola TaxID=209389 RepID=A0ABU6MM11_9BACI|nr:aspartyl-phosphate phosphatase Spo0E family protein [Heyndrickxia acidicola]MED1204658.1 aspartyl-phosphate phosphatase Spo0E family protein [Heyndrickxia acidicola]
MMKNIIEDKRQQLYEAIGLSHLTSEETLRASRELERFMNFHFRVRNSPAKGTVRKAAVHSNAITSILEVASREKLELPFEFNPDLLRHAEWYSIDVIHTLLLAVSEKYGNEAVESIGEIVPERCIFPQTVQSFEESLQQLNRIFHLNHKSSAYIGEYLPYTDVKNEMTVFCHTPHYPAAFNRGILAGFAKKFNHSIKLKELDLANGGQFKING